MNRLTVDRSMFVGVRLIAVYLGARALIGTVARLIFMSNDEIRWRFFLGEAAGVIVAIILWAIASPIAGKVRHDSERHFDTDRSTTTAEQDEPAGRSTDDLLRIAFVIIGALFIAWGIEGLARTSTSSVAADPRFQFGRPTPGWFELYRDNLVGSLVQLGLGIFFLRTGRRGTAATPEAVLDTPEDEGQERVTFKFD